MEISVCSSCNRVKKVDLNYNFPRKVSKKRLKNMYDFSRQVRYHCTREFIVQKEELGEVPERLNGAVSLAGANESAEAEKPLRGIKLKVLYMY